MVLEHKILTIRVGTKSFMQITQEQTDILTKKATLKADANNYEKVFSELTYDNKNIPEKFINAYLSIIGKIDKLSCIINKTPND
jgi:hypothetical protein